MDPLGWGSRAGRGLAPLLWEQECPDPLLIRAVSLIKKKAPHLLEL